MSTAQHEAEQRKLAKALESKPVFGKIAMYSFISAFEMLKPAPKPEKPKPQQKPA